MLKESPPPVTPRLPQVERAPAEVPKISAPLLQPVSPSVVQERRLAPVPELEMPRIETHTVPSIAAPPIITQPIEMKPVAVPRLQELAPAPVITQPLDVKAIPTPKIQELAPVPNIETIAKPVEAPSPTVAPPAEPRVEPRIEPRVEPQLQQRETQPQGPERQAPTREAPSPRPAPAPAPGAPGPSDSRKRPDEPAGDYDPFSAPKGLDLDAVKRRAGQLARGTGNTAVLPFAMPAVPPKKSKMEEAIENARKPDCRTAYAGLGLAAVVPLVANEFGEGTCRW